MKPCTEQHFLVALESTVYNVFLAFTSVDEILKFDIQNQSSWKVLLVVLNIMLPKVSLTFEFVHEIQKFAIQIKAVTQYFLEVLIVSFFPFCKSKNFFRVELF